MALTFGNIGPSGAGATGSVNPRTDQLVHGMRIRQLDMTLGATSDYPAGGILIQAVAARLGFRTIYDVLNARVRSSANTIRNIDFEFDTNLGALRLIASSPAVFVNAVQLVGTSGTQTAPLVANVFNLPANALSTNGMAIRYTSWGTKTAAAEAGTIQVVFGSTVANPPVGGQTVMNLVSTANAVAQHWSITTNIVRRTATTQSISSTGIAAADNTATLTNKVADSLFTAGTQDLTTALNLLTTINATTGTTVTLEGQEVELLPPQGVGGMEIVPSLALAAGDIVRLTVLGV